MIAADYSVPDLLRRFAPTPLIAVASLDNTRIVLQTNDPALVSAMQPSAPDLTVRPQQRRLSMKIVRDKEAPTTDAEITIIEQWPLTTLLAGLGTILILDHQRSELLGFLAPSVTTERFFLEMLPLLLRRFRDVPIAQTTSTP